MAREPDYLPSASWERLKLRAETLRRIRAFFDARRFIEVETPLLSHDTVVDRHLDPLRVTLFDNPSVPDRGPTLFLQTSPEFGMKRILAGGEAQAIYQITRAFRGAECGAQHNPEFTMLEWYRVGDDYHAGMQLLAELAGHLFQTSDIDAIRYRDAFRECVGVDPHVAPLEALQQAAQSLGLDRRETDRDTLLNMLVALVVQPKLGLERPTIVFDYPASQAALARTRDDGDAQVAERFELFYRGVELANGYHELLDAEALLERNRRNNDERKNDDKPPLPEQSRLLEAMRDGRLPPCSGCALGVDRLVMLLAGVDTIGEVMAFPTDTA